jgi:hypothetical protein
MGLGSETRISGYGINLLRIPDPGLKGTGSRIRIRNTVPYRSFLIGTIVLDPVLPPPTFLRPPATRGLYIGKIGNGGGVYGPLTGVCVLENEKGLGQCCGSMTFWCRFGSVSGSADPCL